MGVFALVLLAALAALLVTACVTDWRTRLIPNWLNASIAAAAPLFWWTTATPLWPDVAIQVALALGLLVAFAALFALGMMGGGDVKLIAALGLWFPPFVMLDLLTLMAILGGVLTIVILIRHRRQQVEGKPEIPYGIAIGVAGLWTIYRTIS